MNGRLRVERASTGIHEFVRWQSVRANIDFAGQDFAGKQRRCQVDIEN